MNSPIAVLVVGPLILSAFVYLGLIIPVEMFKRSLATVAFKRRVFALALVISYGVVLVGNFAVGTR